MIIEQLTTNRIPEFVTYCKKHKGEIDESFLYDSDLDNFQPNQENPSYIMRDEEGNIRAVASLIIDDYYKKGNRARFRIFHSEIPDKRIYEELLKALNSETLDVEHLFIFVPVKNKELTNYIKELHFEIERYAFFLARGDAPVPTVQFPDDYEVRDFRLGTDEEAWCHVRNQGFAHLKGSETPMTVEMIQKMMTSKDQVPKGAKLLFHNNQPVGVIRGTHDEHNGRPAMSIGPIALLPEYQGRGLGRMLLRMMLTFATENNYEQTVLSVNGENEHARTLYLQEGFHEEEAVVCFKYQLKTKAEK